MVSALRFISAVSAPLGSVPLCSVTRASPGFSLVWNCPYDWSQLSVEGLGHRGRGEVAGWGFEQESGFGERSLSFPPLPVLVPVIFQ